MSRIRKCFSWLLPVPTDAWILATILFWTISAISSWFWYNPSYDVAEVDMPKPVIVSTISMLLAFVVLSISVGLRRRRVLAFALTAVIGSILFLKTGDWLQVNVPDVMLGRKRDLEEVTIQDYLQEYAFHPPVWIGALLSVLLLASTRIWAQGLNDWIVKVTGASAGLLSKHRTRLMIGFVAVMLPATVLRNIFDPEMRSMTLTMIPIYAVIFGGMAIASLYVATQVIVILWKPRFRAVKVGLALGACIGLACLAPELLHEDMDIFCLFALAPICFLLTLLANIQSESDRQKSFSIWSFAMVVPLVSCLGYGLYRYDPTVPLFSLANSRLSTTLLATSQISRDVQRSTGGAGRVLEEYGRRFYLVTIRGKSDANCLDHLFANGRSTVDPLLIVNMQPYVDTESLRQHSGHIHLIRGKVTDAQIEDISALSQSLSLSDIQLPSENQSRANVRQFMIAGNKSPRGLAAFLDAYVLPLETKPTVPGQCWVQSSLSLDDWNAVVRCSQHRNIWISESSIPDQGFDSPELNAYESLSRLTVNCEQDFDRARVMKLFLEKDLRLQAYFMSQTRFWELAFAKASYSGHAPYSNQPIDFAQKIRELNWVYGVNDRDQITHLWLPDVQELKIGSQEIAKMQKLSTLRLDRRGYMSILPVEHDDDMNIIGTCTTIERLYLDSGHFVNDLRFLRPLTNLRHLQIQSQTRGIMPYNGFDVCTALESMRIFGTPDPITVKELAKLKKLQRLEIVDDDQTYKDEKEVGKLEQRLPNVQIVIIAPEKFTPDLSDTFHQHRAAIFQRLKRRIDKQLQEMNSATP